MADPVNTKFGCSPSTIPLAIGYLKAYAMSKFSKEIDIELFRTFEDMYKAIQKRQPDIVGCSWYGWNLYLTPNALSCLKSFLPNIITVVGGPNVPEKPEDCMRDLKKFSSIDIMIPSEGEIPFANLLNVFLEGGSQAVFKRPLDGAFYLSESKEELVTGRPIPLVEDINIFPSPYLNGYLDEFLRLELMPIIQTIRGCPFNCTFCVAAKDSWNKMRVFDIARVKAEIDYLEANAKNKTLRFTDENFGIIPRDLELAKYVAQKRAKTGYPSAIRVYTHKDINDRIKQITLLLRDFIPMNISSQTLTADVLKNIRRKNIDIDKFRGAVTWAHKNNINVTSEVIFGLPGETFRSFMDVINQLVDLRLDSVAMGSLMMLKETEVNCPESISKYGYKILYSVTERGYTKFNGFENVEIDAWAVENNFFNFKEYIKARLFALLYNLFMFFGYFKEAVYIWENRNVKIADVISELIDNRFLYPFISQQVERFRQCLNDNLFETEEEVRKVFSERFSRDEASGEHIGFMIPFSLAEIIKGDMIHPSNQDKTIDELINASIAVFDRSGKGDRSEFIKETQFAKNLIKSIIAPFWEAPQETVILSSPYDLISWRNQDYRGMLSEFTLPKPVDYKFKIHSLSQYTNFIREHSERPFYIQSEFFFRTFRSNNIRRFIEGEAI